MSFGFVARIGIIVVAVFGLAFLFMPEPTASLYGLTGWNAGTTVIARLFGVSLLFLGAVDAAIRSITDVELQRRVAKYLAGANLLGVVISAHGAATGAGNAMLWTVVAIYLLFLLAWANIAFRR